MCKKKWQERKVAIAGHYNIHHMPYNSAAESIEKRHPGEDKAGFRQRLFYRSKRLATAIREGILRPSAAAQAKMVDAFIVWAEGWAKQDAGEGDIPQVSHDVLQAQLLNSVLPGLDESFCRQRECRSVFRNTDWIHNIGATQAVGTTCARRADSSTGHGWRSPVTSMRTVSG